MWSNSTLSATKDAKAPVAALTGGGASDRIVSIGYLALAQEAADILAEDAMWREWYSFFPWEDWRSGEPPLLGAHIIPALDRWIADADAPLSAVRRRRVNIAFGLDGLTWEEERTLDRYELIYEAGLVVEAWRDREDASLDPPSGEKPVGNEPARR